MKIGRIREIALGFLLWPPGGSNFTRARGPRRGWAVGGLGSIGKIRVGAWEVYTNVYHTSYDAGGEDDVALTLKNTFNA